jgi:hypothetical protein
VSQKRISAMIAALSTSAFAGSSECPAPPVSTSAAAICAAESYLTKVPDAALPMKYQAVELEDHWVVSYRPKDSNVRGGGGELTVDRASGKVSFVRWYR